MWLLQTPSESSGKLRELIGNEAASAKVGGGAFAFVTAAGVKLLMAEPGMRTLLGLGTFELIVGMDAITDPEALSALSSMAAACPNLKPLAFLHNNTSALFHPKTIWFRGEKHGAVIAGSGNLTPGGMNGNWEAASVLHATLDEFKVYEEGWKAWRTANAGYLYSLTDTKVVSRARINKKNRARIRSTVVSEGVDEAIDNIIGESDESLLDLNVPIILVAEVPKSRERWKQTNFDVATYENYFGVKKDEEKVVEFRHVNHTGVIGHPELRKSVAVKSHNYRFEIGAAAGINYPAAGNPILVFKRVSDALFFYMLLMPGESEHAAMQGYLDKNHQVIGNRKRRVVMSLSSLRSIWDSCPLC